MNAFQGWLVTTLSSVTLVSPIMHSKWGWPICESVHFVGLSLLVGVIGMFDLRLLGLAKRVPITALHRLVPWGVLGYIINVVTGMMFLMTDPVEYIYNPAFHIKMLFMAAAGLNIMIFYSVVFRHLKGLGPGSDAPRAAKIVAGVSLLCWIGVTVYGRLLTFYRPGWCGLEGISSLSVGFLSNCNPFP